MIFNMFSWKKIAANKKEFSLIHSIYKNLTANMTLNGDAEVFPSKRESCSVMSNSLWPHGLISPWNSPGQNTGVGCLSLLQGIFPTQGLNPGLLHCRRILYQLSHKENLRMLEWVAFPFSKGSSWPRNWSGFSCITGGFSTSWAISVISL